jgi:hypothetical protein
MYEGICYHLKKEFARLDAVKNYRNSFLKKKSYAGSNPPRFDLMERNIKEEERLRSTKRADLARAMLGGRVQTPHRTTMPFFDPLIDPKSFK